MTFQLIFTILYLVLPPCPAYAIIMTLRRKVLTFSSKIFFLLILDSHQAHTALYGHVGAYEEDAWEFGKGELMVITLFLHTFNTFNAFSVLTLNEYRLSVIKKCVIKQDL